MVRVVYLVLLTFVCGACGSTGVGGDGESSLEVMSAVVDATADASDAAGLLPDVGAESADAPDVPEIALDGTVPCDDDAACGPGVCFESRCYKPCSSQADCDPDEFCVKKTTPGGSSADLCVPA